ncbi:hypothetical protein B0H13DRAFT_2064356 [Mycena leptocephala]|nr:hypothetical protein B0H13DRAFT_2064356 [Mycena leptocephala]
MYSPAMRSSSSLSSESSLSSSSSESDSDSDSVLSPLSNSESTFPSNGDDLEPNALGPRALGWYFPAALSPPSSPMDGSGVVRWQGPISVREDSEDGGARASWIWKNKWLALTGTFLALHEWEPCPQQSVVPLCDVTIIARSDLTPHCLFLETNHGIRRYFSFKHEAQMQEWLDDISCRSPGARSATAFVPYLKDRIQGKRDMVVNLSREGGIEGSSPVHTAMAFGNLRKITGVRQRSAPRRLHVHVPAPSFTSREPRPTRALPQPAMLNLQVDAESAPQLREVQPPNKHQRSQRVRQGPVAFQEEDLFGSRTWKDSWLVLTEISLSLHKSEASARESVVLLRDIVAIERTDRKPYCLLLETQHRTRMRRYLSFKNEQEMCGWLDDISSRAPSISTEPSRVAPPLGPAGPRPYRAPSAWEAQVESSLRPRRGGLPIPPQPRPHPPLPPPRRVRPPHGAP